ncbi:DUF4190 domain-containing protein [Kitasatospora sp. NBC_00315]|uniref:DUF4190 domain-containing protein n=1 Tax=Kitasatospora sp. NBC_00315 TaxID=2975963 RepID=UPI00324D4209
MPPVLQPYDPWAPPGQGQAVQPPPAVQPFAVHPPAGPGVPVGQGVPAGLPGQQPGAAPGPWGGGPWGPGAGPGWGGQGGGWGGQGGWAAVTPGAVSGYPGMYAYPPQRTNGFAIGALAAGLICAWPVAVVLGVIALVQIHKRRERGRGLAVAGLLLSVFGMLLTALVVIGAVADDSAGNNRPFAPRGASSWQQLAAGDCYNPSAGSRGDSEEVAWVAKVPCTLPHHSEVAGTVRIPAATGGGYPGQDEISRVAEKLCAPVLAGYVLDDWAIPDGVEATYLYPTEDSWKSSGGLLTCVLEDSDALHRGTLRTDRATLTAAQLGYLQAVAPFNEAVDAMPLDEVADAPEDYRLWAAMMARATQDEADKLAAVTWPDAAKGAVDAMIAGKKDSVAAWQAAAAASDAEVEAKVRAGTDRVSRSTVQARAVRAALGLATGERPGDLQV